MTRASADPAASALRLLTIDRGNSTLDCMFAGPGVVRRERLSDPAGIHDFLRGEVPDRVAAVSVVPGALEPLREQFERSGIAFRVAGVELPCPLRTRYPDPSSLGADRWVGAVAAWQRFGDAVIVDCGTAWTCNLVSSSGEFLGGSIGAGLTTMALGLRARAPGLPLFDGGVPATSPPVTTEDAVRLGIGQGFRHMVEAVSARLAAEAGLDGAVRVLTGGEAAAFLRLGGGGFVHVPDLIHEGLRWLDSTRASGC
jgi:pantothenate kinase type III